jgi:hypothetical protein
MRYCVFPFNENDPTAEFSNGIRQGVASKKTIISQ